jgi:hypothetical protein
MVAMGGNRQTSSGRIVQLQSTPILSWIVGFRSILLNVSGAAESGFKSATGASIEV